MARTRLYLSANKLFLTTKETFTTVWWTEQSWERNQCSPKPLNHLTSFGKIDILLVPTTMVESLLLPSFLFLCLSSPSLLFSLSRRVKSSFLANGQIFNFLTLKNQIFPLLIFRTTLVLNTMTNKKTQKHQCKDSSRPSAKLKPRRRDKATSTLETKYTLTPTPQILNKKQKSAKNLLPKLSKQLSKITLSSIWSLLSISSSELLFLWLWHTADAILNQSSCNLSPMSSSFASSSILVFFQCSVLLTLLDKFQLAGSNRWTWLEEILISTLNGSLTLVQQLLVQWKLTLSCQLVLNSFTSESELWRESWIKLVPENLEPNAQLSNSMLTFMLDPFTWCNSNILLSWLLFTLHSCSVPECQYFSH